MTVQTWVLCDTERGIYVDEFSIDSEDVAGSPSGWHVHKRTLRGGLQDGVDIVEVNNGSFRFALIPTRGMSIWRAWIGDQMIGWRSPIRGPVHPKFVPLFAPDGLGWLEGFDELLVRCGLGSIGAPDFDETGKLIHPLHGRIGNLPAHRVEVRFDGQAQEISVSGIIEESRFHFQTLRLKTTITTRVGYAGVTIHDDVLNLSGRPATMQMLYHINIGRPFLTDGSKLVAPVKTLVPWTNQAAKSVESWSSFDAGHSKAESRVYLFHLLSDDRGCTQVLLKNAAADFGMSLRYNVQQLPCFTQWKNPVAEGDGVVMGLEPGTNFPNCRRFEDKQGRVVRLDPGQHQVFDLDIRFCSNSNDVASTEKTIAALQASAEPRMHDAPQDGWCACQ
jgi:hypothetical protein